METPMTEQRVPSQNLMPPIYKSRLNIPEKKLISYRKPLAAHKQLVEINTNSPEPIKNRTRITGLVHHAYASLSKNASNEKSGNNTRDLTDVVITSQSISPKASDKDTVHKKIIETPVKNEVEELLVHMLKKHTPLKSFETISATQYKKFAKEISRLPELKMSKKREHEKVTQNQYLQEHIKNNMERSLNLIIQKLRNNSSQYRTVKVRKPLPQISQAYESTKKPDVSIVVPPLIPPAAETFQSERPKAKTHRPFKGGYLAAALKLKKAKPVPTTTGKSIEFQESKDIQFQTLPENNDAEINTFRINRKLSKYQQVKGIMEKLGETVNRVDGQMTEIRKKLTRVTKEYTYVNN